MKEMWYYGVDFLWRTVTHLTILKRNIIELLVIRHINDSRSGSLYIIDAYFTDNFLEMFFIIFKTINVPKTDLSDMIVFLWDLRIQMKLKGLVWHVILVEFMMMNVPNPCLFRVLNFTAGRSWLWRGKQPTLRVGFLSKRREDPGESPPYLSLLCRNITSFLMFQFSTSRRCWRNRTWKSEHDVVM